MSRAHTGWCSVVLLAVIGAGLLPGQGPDRKDRGDKQRSVDRLALVVGVKSYRSSQDLPDLEYTEEDVKDLSELLRRDLFLVAELTSSSLLRPDRRLILGALERHLQLASQTAAADPGRKITFLVALAGHGVQPSGGSDCYFCPADAVPTFRTNLETGAVEPLRPETLLSLNELQETIGKSKVTTTLYLIDACRNSPTAPGGAGIDGSRFRVKNGAALFSCSPEEQAYEARRLGRGLFFHTVCAGLEGKAADSSSKVTWSRLVDYVQQEVPVLANRWIGRGVAQTPMELRRHSGPLPLLADLAP